MTPFTPSQRLAATLTTIYHEGLHLGFSRDRIAPLLAQPVRLTQLEANPEDAERLEAFASRFGRMQDTIGEKLLPRWLEAMAERPGAVIDVLNRAERLGALDSAAGWLAIRQLRNQLVHEYMRSVDDLHDALRAAYDAVSMLFETYNRVRSHSVTKGIIAESDAPDALTIK